MRKFSLSKFDPNRVTVILLNGGGQQPYNKFHKVVKLFNKFNCNTVALELPGHGKSPFSTKVTADEMLNDFYHEFLGITSEYDRIGIFGFSLGALLSLKLLEQKIYTFEFVISMGAGLKISKDEEKVMQVYASQEFFEKMRWHDIMMKYHKNGWKTLLDSLPPMLRVDSELMVSADFKSPSPLHLMVGDRDGVVDYQLQQEFLSQESIEMHVIDETDHFEYFTKSWTTTSQVLTSILSKYIDLKQK